MMCVEWTPGRGFYIAKKNENNGIIGTEISNVLN